MLLAYASQVSSADGAEFVPNMPLSTGYIKILASGELSSMGNDRCLLVRINDLASGYDSYVNMSGNAFMIERDNRGFYVGRNGWLEDAAFTLDYTLAVCRTSQKITGSGMATFSQNRSQRILGYSSHGSLLMLPNITKIAVSFDGGVFTGDVRFYVL